MKEHQNFTKFSSYAAQHEIPRVEESNIFQVSPVDPAQPTSGLLHVVLTISNGQDTPSDLHQWPWKFQQVAGSNLQRNLHDAERNSWTVKTNTKYENTKYHYTNK